MKAIVVEDSRLAREGLLRMLEAFPDLEVLGAADHPNSAIKLIEEHHPDVLFLDIHMPGESGFDLLDKLDYAPHVVFTTAYSEHAYRSFDYNAVDYLLKPVSPERLAEAVEKLGAAVYAASDVTAHEGRLHIDSKMFIKDGDNCHLVTLNSIRYFESCKNHVRVFFEGHSAFVRKALSNIEKRLPRERFFRASRQYVVNLHHIERIDESIGDGYELTMDDGKLIEVSRRNAAELRALLSF